jgi:polysaccharide biosynthesis transport protein
MSFAQFLAILRARWLAALVVFAVVAGGTLLYSLLTQKSYTASATVVIDVKPDPLGGLLGAGGLTPALVETQLDIIQSDRVALRVVRNLKLADNPGTRAQWQESTGGQGDFELWLSETLQRNLEARPSRASGVITVSYRSPDPKFAAALANAFASAYLQTALELRVDPAKQYTNFFDSRTKEARDNLERAQARASAYQRDNNLISIDERFDIETARLNELSSQLTALQAVAAESTSRQAQAQSAQSDRLSDVLNNPLVASMKADVARTESRLQEMSIRLGDNHPQVQEARATLNEQRTRLETEVRRVTGSVGINNTINRARESEVRASLDAQRAKVLKLKALRDEGQVLQREVENVQRLYEQVAARSNQSSIESQTNQTNLSLLSEARAPNVHSTPRVFLNTALGSVLALVLAVAVALGFEAVDRRVRLPSDIVDAVDLPIIANIPKPARRMLGGAEDSRMRQRLLGSPNSPNATAASATP